MESKKGCTMEDTASDKLTIHEYSLISWIFGGFWIIVGIWLMTKKDGMLTGLICLAFGALLAVVLSPLITMTIDKQRGLFAFSSRWLLFKKSREIPLAQVSSVDIESSRSHSRGRSSTTYRLAVVTTDGERIPITSVYSSGYSGKVKKANQLNTFLGIALQPVKPLSNLIPEIARQALKSQYAYQQDGVTDGINWHVETTTVGAVAITRWVSTSFTFPGQFLYLTQKPQSQKNLMAGGLLAPMSQMLYRQSISMYGFQPEDTPGIETAQTLDSLEPRLDPHYLAFTSDPYGARQLLNPWAVLPLVQWAIQHPIKQIQKPSENPFIQLVVLFSPRGLYIAYMNSPTAERIEAITHLGVDLMRALGPIPPNNIPGSQASFSG
jgi:hypothetical protein